MTNVISRKRANAKAEKLRKSKLPSKLKKTNERYRENKLFAKASKIKSKETLFLSTANLVSDEEIKALSSIKKKKKRKRNNSKSYINRKLKKQTALRNEVTFDTPEKRQRLIDVYECNTDVVIEMDRYEVIILFSF